MRMPWRLATAAHICLDLQNAITNSVGSLNPEKLLPQCEAKLFKLKT